MMQVERLISIHETGTIWRLLARRKDSVMEPLHLLMLAPASRRMMMRHGKMLVWYVDDLLLARSFDMYRHLLDKHARSVQPSHRLPLQKQPCNYNL
jgi:hypothetical protein